MARHSSGKNNFAVAGWVWAVVVASGIGAGVWAVNRGGDNEAAAPTSEVTVTTSAASESTSAKPVQTSAASTTPPKQNDTLFLVDLSANVAPMLGEVTGAVADVARDLGAQGHSVALWNYSSPLSPGVTVGYRDNLNFGPAEEVATVVDLLGTGGVPQTRSAVVAAVDRVSDRENPASVVVVTTGTEQDMDDATFRQALEQVLGDKVSLRVVHLGDEQQDQVLADAAETVATSSPADLAQTLRRVAGL